MDNINAQFVESTPGFINSILSKILNLIEQLRLEGVYQAHKLVDYVFLNKTIFYVIFFVLLFLIIRYLWRKFA